MCKAEYVVITDQQIKLLMSHTESSRILEAFKSRKMTFWSRECKNASPLATPIAMLTLVTQAIGWTPSAETENKILG